MHENKQHGHENTCMIKGTKMCQVSNHSIMSLKYGLWGGMSGKNGKSCTKQIDKATSSCSFRQRLH